VTKRALKGYIPREDINPQLDSLLQGLLKPDPDQRLRFEGIKNHPFLSDVFDDIAAKKSIVSLPAG
jgi:serine/threonine protein kinase